MANSSIKGITIQIGGDTTGLQDALKKVNSEAKETETNLKFIDKALKLDPKNTELVAQKQRALADAVKISTDKLKALKQAQEAMAEEVSKGTKGAQKNYDLLTRQIVFANEEVKQATKAQEAYEKELKKAADAEKAAAEAANHVATNAEKLKEKINSLDETLSKTSKSMQQLGEEASEAASKTKALSIAGAAIAGGLATAALKSAQWADDLKTLSQQTGLTTDEIQRMQYASELVDVSVDSMTGAMAKLTKNMTDTGGAASQAFDRLGVSVVGVDGQMRSSSEVFYSTLEALSRVGNETERDQLAMQLFGRSANELAGIIDDGGAALRAYGDEAERNGAIIDESLVNSMASFQDKIDAFKAAALPELIQAGGNAIEALTPLIETLMLVVSELLNMVGDLDPTLLSVVATLGLFAASISPIAAGIGTITTAMTSLSTVMATTGGQISVIVAILGLFAILVAQIVNAWDDMSGWEKAISVMGALVVAAAAAAVALGAVQSAATMGIAAAAIVAGVVAITTAVNSATKQKNSAPNVMTAGSRSAGGNTNTYNTYNTTTNNYGGTRPQAINVNIDGRQAAQALYDPLQDIGQNRGPQFAR